MQITSLYIISTLTAVIMSAILACYLIFRWSRQGTKMYSDLPFVFGVTFIMQGMNILIQTLIAATILPDTIEIFRVRSLVIAGTAFPMLGALLAIWAPRKRKHHWKILLAVLVYWLFVTVVGPDETTIMSLLIPVLLVMMIGLAITFAITWKTGRLKEVRSDLMLLCLILIIFSQLTRISLSDMGLVFIPDSVNVIATIIATVALVNPWYKRGSVGKIMASAEQLETP